MPCRSALVLVTVLLLSPAPASAQADSIQLRARGYLQVAEPVVAGVHVLRQAEPNFAGVIGNVTVIEQRDGLVLIDAGVSHGTGVRIVEMVRSISPKPVKSVVITHWHGDHFLGLSAIRAAWPQAEIISHQQAAADIDARMKQFPRAPSAAYEAERIRSLREVLVGLEANEAVKAATPEERGGWRTAAVDNRELRLADVAGTYLILPQRTFKDSLTLDDPIAPITLLFLGRANTSGDISAWLPQQQVLVTGDIVVAPVPFMFNVYPSEALAVFERLRALPFQVLVPGHGTLQRDSRYLDLLSDLLSDVRAQVGPLARADVALAQVAGRTDLSRQRERFAGSNAWLRYWFDQYTVTPLIESVYTEARGAALGPPPPAP